MALFRAGNESDLASGKMMEVEEGGRTFVICNVNGEILCVDGICPHAGGPLGQGALHGDTIVCPWHGWEFNCRTGATVEEDGVELERFAVRVENGQIFIETSE